MILQDYIEYLRFKKGGFPSLTFKNYRAIKRNVNEIFGGDE